MAQENGYVIGNLYPTKPDGTPNIILSSELVLEKINGRYIVKSRSDTKRNGTLETDLAITTNSVNIPGIDAYVKKWLAPQLTSTTNPNSIFNQYLTTILSNWTGQSVKESLSALKILGYKGLGSNQSQSNLEPWISNGKSSGPLYEAVNNPLNYDPAGMWNRYTSSNQVNSNFNLPALLQNLEAGNKSPNSWQPSIVYTYSADGQGASYPGPVLMLDPGDRLLLNFKNDITIPGLTEEQVQAATLIPNSSYGLNGGATAGGAASVNFHMHGGHVNAMGFGDNVVARYTTGQDWTTDIDIPSDHGQGSYWYHPHYHPAVNTQLYGGLSGFMQVGDPLEKIPAFKNVARNLAVFKSMNVGIDTSGNLLLEAVDTMGVTALPTNRMSMITVNGQYQPTVEVEKGGWQALTLSNQDSNYYLNIKLKHLQDDGTYNSLPIYIYGEDGHQYPQIRAANQTVIGYDQPNNPIPNTNNTAEPPIGYKKADNIVALPAGKRLDILFYLPSGQTEISSVYSFEDLSSGKDYQINNLRFQASQYVDFTNENTSLASGTSGFGPLAIFKTGGNERLPNTNTLNNFIDKANEGIVVQNITPVTPEKEYNPSAVPSVDLFSTTEKGAEIWTPTRKREFNYSVLTLVGPQEEYDAPTKAALAENKLKTGNDYKRYTFLPHFSEQDPWLGYVDPDLINDHVFPNGNLSIAQLGTMEEWRLRNWNWGFGQSNGNYFVGHPFHIHVNDYQVKSSDTELGSKKNLEDTTMLNSSGYNFYDTNTGRIRTLAPMNGEFHSIPEALDPALVGTINTTGANDTTIRMLFQDYLGTYVQHCHLLEHEDAGMMTVITVVENTADSWLAPSQGFNTTSQYLTLYKAQDFKKYNLNLGSNINSYKRAQFGDLNGDFVQDIVLTRQGVEGGPGQVLIYDGASLKLDNQTREVSNLVPYSQSSLAPWAFPEDYSGDGQRDLITGGFISSTNASSVSLTDFAITNWVANKQKSTQNNIYWDKAYQFQPWQSIESSKIVHHTHELPNGDIKKHYTDQPPSQLNAAQVGFVVGDFNLDNFNDYAIAYYVSVGGFRITILDGAAFSLAYQTGTLEGGYFPNSTILADSVVLDPSLTNLSEIVLTSGFNSYAQSPIENLIVTTQSSIGSQVFTLQLAAGHFIATSQGEDINPNPHSGHVDTSDGSASLVNLRDDAFPLYLSSQQIIPSALSTATPIISGALGQGGLLVGDTLTIAQGNSSIGNRSNTDNLLNTTQQIALDLGGLRVANQDDITGIIGTNLKTTFEDNEVYQRLHLAGMAYQAYTNTIITPASLADLSAGILGQQKTAEQLAGVINALYQKDVANYYGDNLNNLAPGQIIEKAYETLYGRSPSPFELRMWLRKVSSGLDRSLIPLAIMQEANGIDVFRLGYLSAGMQWMQSQWQTTATVAGSFSQGFQTDDVRFNLVSGNLLNSGTFSSWDAAQQGLNNFMDSTLPILRGSPISNTGFF